MKGQGLSITTIVVAAIALLILVVLVAVFTGQFGSFASTTRACEDTGGTCLTDAKYDENPGNYARLIGKNCPNDASDVSQSCYVPLSGTCEDAPGKTGDTDCGNIASAVSCANNADCVWR